MYPTGVLWKVIEQIRHDRYTTVMQGVNRFQDAADLRTRGPDDLELEPLGYDNPKKKLVITRMQGAIDQMKAIKNSQAEMTSKPLIAQTKTDFDRKSLERVFKDAVGHAPPIEHQGCNQLLATMNKAISEGRLEVHSNKQTIPFIPSPTIQTRVRKHDTADYQELTREPPTHEEDWLHQMRIFYTSLYMVLTAHKEIENLQVTWEVVRDFYEKFSSAPWYSSARNHLAYEYSCWQRGAAGERSPCACAMARTSALPCTTSATTASGGQTSLTPTNKSKTRHDDKGKVKARARRRAHSGEREKAKTRAKTRAHTGTAAHSTPSQRATAPNPKAKAKTRAKTRKAKASNAAIDYTKHNTTVLGSLSTTTYAAKIYLNYTTHPLPSTPWSPLLVILQAPLNQARPERRPWDQQQQQPTPALKANN